MAASPARAINLTGIGLVLTVASFAVEGLVNYYDRSELKALFESSYFGIEPKFRRKGSSDAKLWDAEAKALEGAMAKLAAAAAGNDKIPMPGEGKTSEEKSSVAEPAKA